MNSGLISIKNVSLVTMLAAASAAAIYLLNAPQKHGKEKEKIGLKGNDNEAINEMMHELQSKREEILRKFDDSQNRVIPKEMLETINYIYSKDPNAHPPQIRLLCSQLIQDYAIMYTNIKGCEPESRVVDLAKAWLDFPATDVPLQIEQINHRYALALRSRSVKEFRLLHKWLQDMDKSVREQRHLRHNWILRNFQCACILGMWKEVLESGRQLEKMDHELLLSNQPFGQQSAPPLHPLHLFDYIALRLPNQSANFTQVYFNVERYMNWFDPRLTPPLKFTEWQITDCITQLKFAFSTDSKRHQELQDQIEKGKPSLNESLSKFMFVYGCLVQYPCSWVQLPAGKDKIQPAVLCGPWNDTEMELTASYVRRRSLDGENEEEKKDANKMIQVVRSDLRLHLDRCTPSMTGSLQEIANKNNNNEEIGEGQEGADQKKNNGNENDYNEMMDIPQSMTAAVGWKWRGTLDHEEGVMEIKESDISNFEFRRDWTWKDKALACTCRTWDIQMVVSTPD